jgi:hypothetical protein
MTSSYALYRRLLATLMPYKARFAWGLILMGISAGMGADIAYSAQTFVGWRNWRRSRLPLAGRGWASWLGGYSWRWQVTVQNMA